MTRADWVWIIVTVGVSLCVLIIMVTACVWALDATRAAREALAELDDEPADKGIGCWPPADGWDGTSVADETHLHREFLEALDRQGSQPLTDWQRDIASGVLKHGRVRPADKYSITKEDPPTETFPAVGDLNDEPEYQDPGPRKQYQRPDGVLQDVIPLLPGQVHAPGCIEYAAGVHTCQPIKAEEWSWGTGPMTHGPACTDPDTHVACGTVTEGDLTKIRNWDNPWPEVSDPYATLKANAPEGPPSPHPRPKHALKEETTDVDDADTRYTQA